MPSTQIVVGHRGRAGRSAIAQGIECQLHQFNLRLGVAVAALGFFAERVCTSLKALEISDHQFGFDRFRIGNRINAPFDVRHVFVFEAPQDMDDRVDLANMTEELIAQSFTFAGATHEAGDVGEVEVGRNDLNRL